MTANEQAARDEAGAGWYEVIHPITATTNICLVYEDGSMYFPEGEQFLSREEFIFAAARGRAYRLIRESEAPEQWAESALLARLSDPAPVEAACVAFTKSAGDDDWQVLSERERESYRRDLRAALAAAAAHLTDHQVTAANCGGCCAWCGGTGAAYSELTSICEDCRGTGHTDDHDSVSVVAHLTDPTPAEDSARSVPVVPLNADYAEEDFAVWADDPTPTEDGGQS